MRIIVTGLVGLNPLGGVAWDYLQYVIGLDRLGHDVYYHENTRSWPYNPITRQYSNDAAFSVGFIKSFFEMFAPNLAERWHYLHIGETSFGMARSVFDKVAATADLFINVSGANLIPEKLSPHCVKVFLDTDPGYNQIILSMKPSWLNNVKRWRQLVEAHDRYFTYAENIRGQDCKVPCLGYNWFTTRMPVVMPLWGNFETQDNVSNQAWTTVMTWNAFKRRLIFEGVEYKSKSAEFEKILNLPAKMQMSVKLAVGGITSSHKWLSSAGLDSAYRLMSNIARIRKLRKLRDHGWKVIDGPSQTATPEQYQSFISDSYGEISIAKNVYVAMRTGWFSCRSACYLAAGKPVVVQDTGFGNILPVGEGVLSFQTIDEAADSIRQVQLDYPRHSAAAREIAEEYFNSDKVLSQMLERAMAAKSDDRMMKTVS